MIWCMRALSWLIGGTDSISLVCVFALCTLVFNANMGQAGIGAIDQVQVSNYCPVPPNAVIAQPQMLFLFLDHHLNSPPLQISATIFFIDKRTSLVTNAITVPVITAFREDDFDRRPVYSGSNPLSQFVLAGFPQPCNAVPAAGSLQKILAVLAPSLCCLPN